MRWVLLAGAVALAILHRRWVHEFDAQDPSST